MLGTFALGMLVFNSVATAQTVTVTTTYEYDEETLQVKAETVDASDGAYRRTEYTYAYEQYGDLRTANRLTGLYETRVLDANGAAVACSQTLWDIWAENATGIRMPRWVHEGCGAEDEHVSSFNAFDALGRPTETKAEGGIKTEYFYGTNALPFSNATSNPLLTGIRHTGDYYTVVPLERHVEYDDRHRLTAAYDENGKATRYEYDGLGRLTGVSDHGSILLAENEYAYSDDGNGDYDPTNPNYVRTTLHAQSDRVTTAWFDGLGRPISTGQMITGSTDYMGLTEYDAAGRPFRAWKPVDVQNARAFVPSGDLKAEMEAYYVGFEGNGSGASNRPYSETTYEASPLARPTFVREPGAGGHGVTYRYGVENPCGSFSGCSVDGPMAYTETEDAEGRKARTYTDGLGRGRFVRAGVGSAEETLTEMRYDAADRLVQTRPPTYFSPRAGDTTPRSTHATTYTYTTRGHLVETRSPDVGVTRFKYDVAGRVRFRAEGEAEAVEMKSGSGDLGVAPVTAELIQYYMYDRLGRLILAGEGRPDCTWGELDPNGANPSCPEVGTAAYFEYYGPNRRRENIYDDPADHPEGIGKVYGWPIWADNAFPFDNTKGRLAASAYESDGVWQSVLYSYDDRGNVSDRWVNTQGEVIPWEHFSYTHDEQGTVTWRQVEVGPYASEQQFTYLPTGALRYVYSWTGDSASSSRSLSSDARYWWNPDGTQDYVYLYGVAYASGARQTDYSYDVQGRLIGIGDVNGSQNPWTDPGLPPPANPAKPFAAHYDYDAGGLIERAEYLTPYAVQNSPYSDVPEAQNARWYYSYDYDALGRLMHANYMDSASSAYAVPYLTYDGNGNLLSMERRAPSGVTHGSTETDNWLDKLTYTYTAGTNRLASVADQSNDWAMWNDTEWDADAATFSYTPDGTLYRETPLRPSGKRTAYRYVYRFDEQNRPLYERTRHQVGMTTESYAYRYFRYDGDGQRITKETTGGGESLRYVRDGGAVVAVLDGVDGGLSYWNLYGVGLMGRIGAGGRSSRVYYTKDHLRSVRAAVDAAGFVVEARDYYPFGLEMPGRVYVQGSETREGFTGHELDAETGMYYAGARYYMPALGRWTSVDPLAAKYPGFSPYNYVLNNPVSLLDPDGQEPCCLGGGQMALMVKHVQAFLGDERARRELKAGYTEVGRSIAEFAADTPGDLFHLVTGYTPGLRREHRGYAVAGLLLPGVSSRAVRAVDDIGRGWLRRSGRFDHINDLHVGKSDSFIQDRATTLRDGEASTFLSESQAEEAIVRALKGNSSTVDDWVQGASRGDRRAFDFSDDQMTGRIATAGSGRVSRAYGTRVVLEYQGDGNYHIVTAHPLER